MKFVADENVPGLVVRWLRETGHDVLWIAEDKPGSDDTDSLQLAHHQQRVVITQD